MNLLFLEQHPRFIGGSERISLTLCRQALRQGHRASLIYAHEGDMVSAYAAAGAMCRRHPVVPLAIRKPAEARQSLSSLRRAILDQAIDIVFTSQVSYVSLIAAVASWTAARSAVHLGLICDYPSPLFRAGIRRIDLGVAPSTHAAEAWRQRGWPSRTLRVIPNGIDTTVFQPADGQAGARCRLGLPDSGEPLVVYLGRLVQEKGVFTLLRAFSKYRRDGGVGRLLFVGMAPADECERLRRLASEERLSDHAWEVRPPTAAPEDVYHAADLVVVPSECDEAFGLVPLEAMACGTMTIVSDRGLLPDFVAPVGAAACFPAGDVDALQRCLRQWLNDDDGRRIAACRLSQHARAEFGFERCGDAYLEAFRALLS